MLQSAKKLGWTTGDSLLGGDFPFRHCTHMGSGVQLPSYLSGLLGVSLEDHNCNNGPMIPLKLKSVNWLSRFFLEEVNRMWKGVLESSTGLHRSRRMFCKESDSHLHRNPLIAVVSKMKTQTNTTLSVGIDLTDFVQ
jgi:hypothetical protein